MFKRGLRCSFCGLDETRVAKLVAGPNAFICDQCVSKADGIMKQNRELRTVQTQTFVQKVFDIIDRVFGAGRSSHFISSPKAKA